MKRTKKIFDDAKKTVNDKEGISKVLSRASNKLTELVANSTELKEFKEKSRTLMDMMQHHLRGDYKAFSNSSIILVVFALIYFITPTDVIPDFVPALGFTDDASVLFLIYRKLGKDIEGFLSWRESNLANEGSNSEGN